MTIQEIVDRGKEIQSADADEVKRFFEGAVWDKRKAEIVGMKRAFQGDEFLQLMRMTQAYFNGAFDVTDSCFAAMVIEGG